MFIDHQDQCYEHDYITEIDIQIQCNPHQNSNVMHSSFLTEVFDVKACIRAFIFSILKWCHSLDIQRTCG